MKKVSDLGYLQARSKLVAYNQIGTGDTETEWPLALVYHDKGPQPRHTFISLTHSTKDVAVKPGDLLEIQPGKGPRTPGVHLLSLGRRIT